MDIAFKNLIYDYYSKDLSKKVKSAMGMKQEKAKFVNTVPYGYKADPTDKHRRGNRSDSPPYFHGSDQRQVLHTDRKGNEH